MQKLSAESASEETHQEISLNSSIFGNCHCGLIGWEAKLPPKIVLNCHCNLCRSLSGAAYSSWVVLPTELYSVTKGSEHISEYQATDNYFKSFCSNCGSTINCVNNDKFPEHTYIARASIKNEVSLPVDIQVYTTDKAHWIDISDDIPAFNP